jgi:hypothetical protein
MTSTSKYEEFRARTIWSLSNAFPSAFKELDPIPQFKATATLGEFLKARFSQSFSDVAVPAGSLLMRTLRNYATQDTADYTTRSQSLHNFFTSACQNPS